MTLPAEARRPLSAILLSLGLPGLGEIYAGRPKRGLATLLVFYAFSALTILTIFAPLSGVGVILVPLVIALIAWMIVFTRAARAARQAPQPYELRPYNRWYWYAVAVLVSIFILQPAVLSLIRSRFLQAFRIPSAAMEPTLLAGDFIFAAKSLNARKPNLNSVVIVESPDNAGLLVIKRVVGMPGDTLSMSNGVLIRNGGPATEPFVQNTDSAGATAQKLRDGRPWHLAHLVRTNPRTYEPDTRNWGPILVPNDSVFLLGDTRDESFDSRFYGAVGRDRIRGKPLVIYFSMRRTSVRWGRVGRRF